VAVGLANIAATASVGITHLVRRGITIAGSYGARTRTDLPAVVGLVADGSVRLDQVITRRVTLDEAADTYAALDRGEIVGRAVVVLEDQ
jgi:succinate semialdehyde reductase (NADPH)